MDPRNGELLTEAAFTYEMLRQFPAALKLYDRALDITPHELDVMVAKARVYHAQGNLQEAARLLSEVNEQVPSGDTFVPRSPMRLERNYDKAIRSLQTRLTQFHYATKISKISNQLMLAINAAPCWRYGWRKSYR